MGIGVSHPVKLVILSEQQGSDGVEPLSEEIANTYAQINYISQSRYCPNGVTYKLAFVNVPSIASQRLPKAMRPQRRR